ncbi:MAG: glycosyltransferase family 2 protein [Acidobacteria bacterium]|nr:glycosyltransferase family 2 protein [Acidobacteriota bacterium]
MASISYWFLSPSVVLALLGKLKGWDRTKPTPNFSWRSTVVDVVVPAKNEESSIDLCLASILEQDFPIRKITVVDDGSTDRTAQVVRRFAQLSGREIGLVVHGASAGKTPSIREQCELTDSDALLVVDADTVLCDRNYVTRLVQEVYRNAGVACACGEITPLTRRRRRQLAQLDPAARTVESELQTDGQIGASRWQAFLEFWTVLYRTSLYMFLQRILYDGHMKLFGSRLSPTGCGVLYRTSRLRECFAFAAPHMGDNLSNSEDIFIGHFFNWKGYRNVQVAGVRCESIEPAVTRLPRQLYNWSSSFLQTLYYFRDLPLSPFRKVKKGVAALFEGRRPEAPNHRIIQEQYRAPWGEQFTRRWGRGVGLVDLVSMIEKVSYPVFLILLAIFAPRAALLTIGVEVALTTTGVFLVAESGTRLKSAGMMLASTPIRLFSLGVDLVAVLRHLFDLATGNRKWRK